MGPLGRTLRPGGAPAAFGQHPARNGGPSGSACTHPASADVVNTVDILRAPNRLWPSLVVLVVALVCATAAAEELRPASKVVVRGVRTFERALQVATYEVWRRPARPRPVALVIDSTPFTAFARAEIETALASLAREATDASATWRIGRLGGRLGAPVREPAALIRQVRTVLATGSKAPSTVAALRRSLARFRTRGGLVVYVADRHFEDDEGLEAFIDVLRGLEQSFCVVGPEAGFQQPYDDACFLAGRAPFGASTVASPWHAGDTAWPHLPGRVTTNTWYFHESLGLPEGLAERLWTYVRREGRNGPADRDAFLKALIAPGVPRISISTVTPSSYGPYGLMRTCAATGGTYVLWSWNPLPSPRAPIYDYGRCNMFPPDLRGRSAIHRDLPRRPLVRALVRAWDVAASHHVGFAAYTAPVREDGSVRAMVRTNRAGLPRPWRSATARAAFLLELDRLLGRLDRAIEDLARAIEAVDGTDDVDRRYRADADLFLHILRLHRFQEAERRGAFLAWEAAPLTLERGERLTWQPQTWVRGGPSPDALRLESVQPHNSSAARAILMAHRKFLQRYAGTPYAELVSRNAIHSYRIVPWKPGPPARGGRGASSSRGRSPQTPVTPAPGGSAGGGPTTGR